jgi:hypothetical protein
MFGFRIEGMPFPLASVAAAGWGRSWALEGLLHYPDRLALGLPVTHTRYPPTEYPRYLLGSASDRGEQISVDLLHYDRLHRFEVSGYTAALVDSAARTVDVENPDGHTPDAALEATQGKMQSALNVAAYCSGKIHFLNANFESHSCSSISFPTLSP